MRGRARWASIAVASLGIVACRGGGGSEARLPVEPIPVTGTAVDPTAGDASVAAASLSNPDDGMPAMHVVLDDPRLAAALDRERAHDPAGAARAVDAALAAAPLEPAQTCAWRYAMGRLLVEADDHLGAAAAFDRVAGRTDDGGAACTLGAYASLRSAEELVHAGKGDDALQRAQAVPDDAAIRDETKLAMADAYVLKGDRASALPLWRALLASAPHGVRWADTSMQLARALLDGVDGTPADHGGEAYNLATRVVVEAPAVAEKSDVLSLRERSAALAHRAAGTWLNPEERLRQAQAWLDGAQSKRALETVEALLKALPAGDAKLHATACKASVLKAQALPKGKSAALADAWGDAIARCDGEEGLVTALYQGGKASASAHRQDVALARFARVEKEFPAHRYADDARLRAAAIVLDQGDTARYVTMLSTLPDAYPEGDMRSEALFRAALQQLVDHDLPGARATLDRALAMPSDDRANGSAGRAPYFRARVAHLAGDKDDAVARYTAVVAGQPLSFYMLLAAERLRDLDAGALRTALDAARTREPSTPFLATAHPELESPAFDRFQRLLEVGELDAARHEASAGGLTADGVDADVLWTVGWSYEQAGAFDVGHSFSRGRLSDFRGHWPAGRWRLPWRVAYPRAWGTAVTTESGTAGIPAPLTWAIMREESAFNPAATSGSNALGLMQLLLGTARGIARGTSLSVDEDSLRTPEVSIALGARLLASMRASFPGNPSLAVASYNCGSSPVHRWLTERGGEDFDVWVERIPYEETRNYVKRVLSSEAAYAELYAPAVLPDLLALPERASGQPASPGP